MNQYLKIPLLIIFANTCAFSQESEGGANLDPDTKVRISQVTFWGGSALLDDDGISPMINPQMTDEVNNENPLDYFPDGFPDKTGQPKPNQVKSYAYSYAATAQPTVEGLFRWKAGVPLAGGPYSASGEVIDTENPNEPARRYRSDREMQESPFTETELRELRYKEYLELKAEFEPETGNETVCRIT